MLSSWPKVLSTPDLVDDEQVAALAGQLGPGVLEHRALTVTGLGGEAHDHRRRRAPPGRDQPGEHVGVAHQGDGRGGLVGRTVGTGHVRLLELVVGVAGRPEVGHRGGHDDDVGVAGGIRHRRLQLERGLDRQHGDTVGRRQRGRGHQGDLRATLGGGPGQGVALLAGRAVAQVAHRVERLAGATGTDDDAAPGQVTTGGRRRVARRGRRPGELALAHGEQLLGLGQPSRAGVAPGQPPGRRGHDVHAALAEGGDVGLGGGVVPHLGVHGGSHDDRAAGGEQDVGEQVVGLAGRGAREQVGGRGGHDDEVGLLADPHVRNLGDVRPDVGVHRLAGQRRPGGLAHEVQGGCRRHDRHVVAGLGEQPQERAGLVRRDAPGHAEDDPHAVTPRWEWRSADPR